MQDVGEVHCGRGAPSSLLPPSPLKSLLLLLSVQMHSGIACTGCDLSYRPQARSPWDIYNSKQQLYITLRIFQAQMAKHVSLQQ